NGSAESVDTLDYEPPPVVPPRRPAWPSNSTSSTASSELGHRTRDASANAATTATTYPLTATAATTTTTSTTLLPPASRGSTTSSSARVSPQPPPLTPPQYPAPPRPPSRNGGDEARVARARGSGRGALPSTILANGTPLSRVPPPRAGWAVRINEATVTTPNQGTHRQQHQQQHQRKHQQHLHASSPGTPRSLEQWASERAPSLSVRGSTSPSSDPSAARATETGSARIVPSDTRLGGVGGGRGESGRGGAETAAGVHIPNNWQGEEELEAKEKEERRMRRVVDAAARYQAEHLELRPGRPMSQNNAIQPLSRPPSSQTSGIAENILDADAVDDEHAVHQVAQPTRVHDHNRPFPPPRLPTVHVASPQLVNSSTLSTTVTQTPPSNPRTPVTAPLSPLSSTFRSRPRNTDAETSPRPFLSNDTPPRSPIGEVSLTVPRPDGERTINEYVEAPFKHCWAQDRRLDDEKRSGDCPKLDRRHQRQKGLDVAGTHHRLHASRAHQAFRAGSNVPAANAAASTANSVSTNAVTKQPVSFTKEPASSLASRTYDPAGLSIMCNFCGRCRCESCREPPPLPSKWLCDNKCFCSADTILDYASCLCCVKGLFYHCVDGGGAGGIDGEAAGSCADEPCSCTGNRKASRWACLTALTLVMPCLLCYWPFKGCVALCELCYARHAAQGCRCNPSTLGNNAGGRHHPIANDIGDSRDPEKRLLDPVTPEL
ncbi:sprouty signaling antagonist, partial [Calliopsis andreniformis]|uniref:sprouty signaling antagonist n=1 Tax=Calliopsis andreniformis TaxID=337506 RepID=UPI003FCDADBA